MTLESEWKHPVGKINLSKIFKKWSFSLVIFLSSDIFYERFLVEHIPQSSLVYSWLKPMETSKHLDMAEINLEEVKK